MNILFYTPNYLPAVRYGGPIRSGHGLARALVDAGHRVQVFTTDVDGPNRLDVPLGVPVDLDGVTVSYFPIQSPRRLYRSPAMARAVAQALPDADVLHLNGCFLWPGPVLAALARRAGVPYVASPRGMLQRDLISGKSPLAKRLWIRGFERDLLSCAGAIHVTSQAEAVGLADLDLDLSPVQVVANGVEMPPDPIPESRIWQTVPRGRRVAFLGRLDWTKGVDLALAAARKLPDAELRLAGPDPIGLRADLTDQGLAGRNARFVGPLAGAEKWAFLAGADVLIAPSLRESFGLAVAEALAVGTPVICTPGVGAGALVASLDPACIAERNTSALARELAALLASSVRRQSFADHGPALIRRDFSWPGICSQMECICNQRMSCPFKQDNLMILVSCRIIMEHTNGTYAT